MKILLSNDDGYDAYGIQSLKKSLSEIAEIWLLAPDRERSASSHAISLGQTLCLKKIREQEFSLDGYPVDCINVSHHTTIFPEFDMVVSGINHGANLGNDVHFSGTVGAARQAAIFKIKSIAISMAPKKNKFKDQKLDYVIKEEEMLHIAHWLKEWIKEHFEKMKKGIVYNINYPVSPSDEGAMAAAQKKWYFTQQGHHSYQEHYKEVNSQQGDEKRYFKQEAIEPIYLDEKETDFEAIQRGHISITPLSTYTSDLKELKNWHEKL